MCDCDSFEDHLGRVPACLIDPQLLGVGLCLSHTFTGNNRSKSLKHGACSVSTPVGEGNSSQPQSSSNGQLPEEQSLMLISQASFAAHGFPILARYPDSSHDEAGDHVTPEDEFWCWTLLSSV